MLKKEIKRPLPNTMKVAKGDLMSILVYAALGTVTAAAYKLGHVYIENKTGAKLETPSEAIENDGKLLPLLSNMEKNYKKYSPVAFTRAVDDIDRIVFLRLAIGHSGNPKDLIGPNTGMDVFNDFKNAQTNLTVVRAAVETGCTHVNDLVLYDKMNSQVLLALEAHMVEIFKLTKM
jgi:hypothetical protein